MAFRCRDDSDDSDDDDEYRPLDHLWAYVLGEDDFGRSRDELIGRSLVMEDGSWHESRDNESTCRERDREREESPARRIGRRDGGSDDAVIVFSQSKEQPSSKERRRGRGFWLRRKNQASTSDEKTEKAAEWDWEFDSDAFGIGDRERSLAHNDAPHKERKLATDVAAGNTKKQAAKPLDQWEWEFDTDAFTLGGSSFDRGSDGGRATGHVASSPKERKIGSLTNGRKQAAHPPDEWDWEFDTDAFTIGGSRRHEPAKERKLRKWAGDKKPKSRNCLVPYSSWLEKQSLDEQPSWVDYSIWQDSSAINQKRRSRRLSFRK